MELFLTILAFVLLAVGLVGCVAPVIPGPPISYTGFLLLQFAGEPLFLTKFMIVWAIIVLVVTLLDYYLPVYMTKRFGGSRAATLGSALGLVAGIFIFPPLGMIVCPFVGAFIGEMINDHRNNAKAFKVAFGSFAAFILGTGLKLIACGMMIYYAVKAML